MIQITKHPHSRFIFTDVVAGEPTKLDIKSGKITATIDGPTHAFEIEVDWHTLDNLHRMASAHRAAQRKRDEHSCNALMQMEIAELRKALSDREPADPSVENCNGSAVTK